MSFARTLQEVLGEEKIAQAVLGLMSALEEVDSPYSIDRIVFNYPAKPKREQYSIDLFGIPMYLKEKEVR